MAIRANDEERSFGADRERQREVLDESGRSARGGVQAGAANSNGAASSPRTRSNRGFASMDRSKQREIASKGGRAAHQKGTAHEFDSNEARAAGRKGGVTVSRNREHMAAIGRRGGEARGANRAARIAQQSGITPAANAAFSSDREVGISVNPNRNAGNAASNAAQRSTALGGESRSNSIAADRNIERP
jgi:general stress protein YciG